MRGVHATRAGVTVDDPYPSLAELLDTLEVPHRIVAEATFESWDPHRRRRLVARLRAEGHEMYVFHPRHTARARKRWEAKKSDAEDARTIYQIATETDLHLWPIGDPDPDWVRRRNAVNREYRRIRLAGDKPLLVRNAVALLGPYRKLDPQLAPVLGNGTEYSDSLLAATWHAAQYATSRREFERLLGLHGSAYPSLLRSDVHHHYFRHAAKRGVTWPQVRRTLRWLYGQFKQARPRPR